MFLNAVYQFLNYKLTFIFWGVFIFQVLILKQIGACTARFYIILYRNPASEKEKRWPKFWILRKDMKKCTVSSATSLNPDLVS